MASVFVNEMETDEVEMESEVVTELRG